MNTFLWFCSLFLVHAQDHKSYELYVQYWSDGIQVRQEGTPTYEVQNGSWVFRRDHLYSLLPSCDLKQMIYDFDCRTSKGRFIELDFSNSFPSRGSNNISQYLDSFDFLPDQNEGFVRLSVEDTTSRMTATTIFQFTLDQRNIPRRVFSGPYTASILATPRYLVGSATDSLWILRLDNQSVRFYALTNQRTGLDNPDIRPINDSTIYWQTSENSGFLKLPDGILTTSGVIDNGTPHRDRLIPGEQCYFVTEFRHDNGTDSAWVSILNPQTLRLSKKLLTVQGLVYRASVDQQGILNIYFHTYEFFGRDRPWILHNNYIALDSRSKSLMRKVFDYGEIYQRVY